MCRLSAKVKTICFRPCASAHIAMNGNIQIRQNRMGKVNSCLQAFGGGGVCNAVLKVFPCHINGVAHFFKHKPQLVRNLPCDYFFSDTKLINSCTNILASVIVTRIKQNDAQVRIIFIFIKLINLILCRGKLGSIFLHKLVVIHNTAVIHCNIINNLCRTASHCIFIRLLTNAFQNSVF